MKIGSGTITGRIASPDTGRVKEYELTLKDISTEAETAGGEVKGHISSPDTGRVGDYTFTLDEVTAEGDLTNGTVKGRIASPDTGNVGTYKLQLKDFQIEGGGGSSDEAGVTFIDYDGTEVKRYSKDAFLALNEMPANPTHEGLISQGWNWTLEDAKKVASEPMAADLVIGQMYITDDGKTRLYVHLEQNNLIYGLSFHLNGTLNIDWGDGTPIGTVTGTSITDRSGIGHTYAQPGDYVIAIERERGEFSLYLDTQTVLLGIKRAELGDVLGDLTGSFSGCTNLESATIPSGVTSIGSGEFNSCTNLKSITIPSGVTSIGSGAFGGCTNLESVAIHEGVTSIGSGAFSGCKNLKSITIPSSVTSIGSNAFADCYSVTECHVKPTTPPTLGSYAFKNNPYPIYVPYSSDHSIIAAYRSVTNWNSYGLYEEEE